MSYHARRRNDGCASKGVRARARARARARTCECYADAHSGALYPCSITVGALLSATLSLRKNSPKHVYARKKTAHARLPAATKGTAAGHKRHADREQHHVLAGAPTASLGTRRAAAFSYHAALPPRVGGYIRPGGHALGGRRAPSGPSETPAALTHAFSGAGTFKLTLTFTEDYPNKAPTVRFESKMFHPNSVCPRSARMVSR